MQEDKERERVSGVAERRGGKKGEGKKGINRKGKGRKGTCVG